MLATYELSLKYREALRKKVDLTKKVSLDVEIINRFKPKVRPGDNLMQINEAEESRSAVMGYADSSKREDYASSMPFS